MGAAGGEAVQSDRQRHVERMGLPRRLVCWTADSGLDCLAGVVRERDRAGHQGRQTGLVSVTAGQGHCAQRQPC